MFTKKWYNYRASPWNIFREFRIVFEKTNKKELGMIKKKKIKAFACILSAAFVLGLSLPLIFGNSPLELKISALGEPYDMTDEYKSGKFYKNLSSLRLSGDESRDVLAIALSQVGYHEGDSNGDMHGESSSGTRDYAEYNVLYGRIDNGQGNGMSYGYYWCASFVNWCLRMAGVDERVSGGEVSCRRWYADAKEMGIFRAKSGYLPSPADLIFFRDEGSALNSTHIGLVRYSDGQYVYTVEGNTSDESAYSSNGEYVALKKYPLTSSYIVGYASPGYEDNKTARSVDHSGKFISLGQYICENGTTVFSDAELTDAAEEGIPAFSSFEITELGKSYFKVRYDGYEGYIDSAVPCVQLTTYENIYTVNYLSESRAPMYMPQYCREGEQNEIYSNRPRREKCGFVGWKAQDGSSTVYSPGEKLPGAGADVILVSVWDENYYVVSFKNEDGTLIDQIHGYYGTEFDFPDAPDAPDGYVFTGWDEDAEGMITGNASYIAAFAEAEEITETEIAESGTDVASTEPTNNGFGCTSAFSGAAIISTLLLICPVMLKKLKR